MINAQWKRRAAIAAMLVLLAATAMSRWLDGSNEVPVERILPNLERRVAKNPTDAHAHYLLGRVLGAAFARDATKVVMYLDADAPERDPRLDQTAGDDPALVASSASQFRWVGDTSKLGHLTPSELCTHLAGAVQHLSLALELAPADALHQLGFACALDNGAHLAAHIDSTPLAATLREKLTEEEAELAATALVGLASTDAAARDGAEKQLDSLGVRALVSLSAFRADPTARRQIVVARLLSNAWRELAIEHYERAFALAFDTDRKHESILLDVRPDLVSFEAAGSYIRLVEQRGVRGEAEAKRLAEIKAGLATLEAIPTWITPILVPDESDATLSSLFDGASASFDLAGIRARQNWPWPSANSSFLVWDPDCSGAITSGRQLFGSATWWMFFEDGYSALDALDALDDNDDGWLAGDELEGLALWRDTDRDGVSDDGEVETLATRGILALATHADGIDGLSPMRSNGVVLSDGRTLPTFDWVASPLPQR